MGERAVHCIARHGAWVPAVVFAALIGVFATQPNNIAHGPRYLVVVLNTVFLCFTGLVVCLLAARTYLAGGPLALLPIGSGMFMFAGADLVSGLMLPTHDVDAAVTVHNIGMAVAGLGQFVGALLLRRAGREMDASGNRTGSFWAVAITIGIAAAALWLLIAYEPSIPAFFTANGPTNLRRIVLGAAIVQFAGAAVLLLVTRAQSPFLRWYGLGLTMVALGLAAVSLPMVPGSPLSWIGRSAQYVGGVYLVVAAAVAMGHGRGFMIPLSLLRETHDRYSRLVEFCPDPILVHAHGRWVYANPAAAQLFGATRPADLLGRDVLAMVHPDDRDAMRERNEQIYHRQGAIAPREIRLRRLDGREVVAEATGIAVEYEGQPAAQSVLRDVTARNAAEAALVASEEQYRLLFESATDGVVLHPLGADRDSSRFLRFNGAACQMLGYAPEEMALLSPIDIQAPEDLPRVAQEAQQMAADKRLMFEKTLVAKDGRRIEAEIHSTIFEIHGRTLVLSLIRDITERKLAETERRVTLEFMDLIANAGSTREVAGAAVSFLQRISGCEAVGIRLRQGDDFPYYEATGFAPGFTERENFLCCRGSDGRLVLDSACEPFLECMCGNIISRRFDASRPFFTPGGSFWTNSTTELLASTTDAQRLTHTRNYCNVAGYESMALVPLCAGDQRLGVIHFADHAKGRFTAERIAFWERLAGSLAVAIAKARAEETHRCTTERFALLSEVSAALLASADPQALVENLCGKVMKHLECDVFFNFLADPSGRLRLNACAGIPAEEAAKIEWLDYGVAVCGCVARDHCRIIAEDIQHMPDERTTLVKSYGVQAYCCHPLMAGERLIGTLSFGSKRRARFAADEVELMRAVAGQVSVAMERIRTEHSLREAKLAAEAASKAKDQFIATLSHELRTPLTPALVAVTQLAKDERLPAEARDDLAMVKRNINLEIRLIADLLDVSRVISGKLSLERRPIDVAAVIHEAAQIVRADVEGKGLTLTINTPGAPYATVADPARLQQVFWNLLRNAIKFTPEGGRIAIDCGLRRGAFRSPADLVLNANPQSEIQNPQFLTVSISDTGCGMPAETLPRLFKAFEQGNEGRNLGGLGLGLTICRAVVELHHGTISVESAGTGKGATFTIDLPLLASAEVENSNFRSEILDSRPQAAPVARSARILLVEDHPETARLMKRLLTAEGHEVSLAHSVSEGILAMEGASRPDLLISDLGLPDGSGHDLMRELVGRGHFVPAIVLSGYGTPDDIARSKAAGFAEHLVKPADADQLLGTIQRLLESNGSRLAGQERIVSAG